MPWWDQSDQRVAEPGKPEKRHCWSQALRDELRVCSFKHRRKDIPGRGNSFYKGHFSTSQKNTVRGTAHDTLTVTCEYAPGWEFYNKWLCRGEDWDSCRILIITTGSEQVVKKGRVSIQDSHRRRLFTVTLEDLWYDDEDTYWCGIEQFGTDKGFKFSVIVDSAPDPIDSPKPVARTTPASRASSLPSAHGINSSQPIVLVNPHSRSGTLVISVAAKTLPVWILLVPPLFATLEWLRQG